MASPGKTQELATLYAGWSTNELLLLIEQASREPDSTANAKALPNIDANYRSRDLAPLGRQIFNRWSRALHSLVCSPGDDDAALRKDVVAALLGKAGGAAFLAGLLVSYFALSPVVAAAVAAILVRVVVAPAADELCRAWERSLAH